MLKKIVKILLVILLVIFIDFILSFLTDYLFKKNVYLNKPFAVFVSDHWFINGLVSLLAVGGTAFFYLFFYTSFVGTKYSQFYKKRGGILIFIIMAFFFMGNMIFMFATSFFSALYFLRVCKSVWLVTFFINKIMENKAAEQENFEK